MQINNGLLIFKKTGKWDFSLQALVQLTAELAFFSVKYLVTKERTFNLLFLQSASLFFITVSSAAISECISLLLYAALTEWNRKPEVDQV